MQQRLEQFKQLLTDKGCRVTAQRVSIYEYLVNTDTHPSAEEIFSALKRRFPMMSPATVYKTLELLVEMGLVAELGFGDNANRYDGNPNVHVNLICMRCRKITDLDEPSLDALSAMVSSTSQFQILGQRHEFYGLCPVCRSTASRSESLIEHPMV